MRNGNAPSPQCVRQSLIMVGSSVRYWYARPAFDSPWYQMAPLMPNGTMGAIIPLYSTVATFGSFPALDGFEATSSAADLKSSIVERPCRLVHASAMVPPHEVWMRPMGMFSFCWRSRPKKYPTAVNPFHPPALTV